MATKTFSNVKLNVAFTPATSHEDNIATGENIANSLGKIAKWKEDFNSVVWDGDAKTVSGNKVSIDVAPGTGDTNKFLRGDGTWVVPTDHTYGIATSSTPGLVKSGTDITVDTSGNVSVKDNSHNHTITNVTGLQDALNGKLSTSLKGAKNGLATLDASGLVPAEQLPSYVDDVIEGYYDPTDKKFYTSTEKTTEITGKDGKIYVDLTTNGSYRWSGTTWINISNPIDADRGLSLKSGKIGHSNTAITAATTAGFKKVGYDGYGHIVAASSVTKADITNLGIPGSDTTYDDATTTAHGLMTAADKSKLNGIAAGAEVNQSAFSNIKVGETTVAASAKTDTVILTAGSNVTITPNATKKTITIAAKDTTYPTMTGATATVAGKTGLVPAPASGANTKVLYGDGTWKAITAYTLPTASASTLGGIKVGSNLSISNSVLSAKTLAGATASADGTAGYVPAPTKAGFTEYTSVNNQFLCGDGKWSSKPVIEEDTLILNCVAD